MANKQTKIKGKGKIAAAIISGVLGITLIAFVLVLFLTPYPAIWILSGQMEPVKVAPAGFAAMKAKVEVVRNLTYPSSAKNNKADLFLPKDTLTNRPVILWVHGGAFVAGDKTDVDYFATALASDGYAVVSINYQLAPSAQFPTPIKQTGEAYQWLSSIKDTYSLDLTKIVLAGDSAGAHTVMVFAQAQFDAVYAARIKVAQVMPPAQIAGLLLYCGPYSIKQTAQMNNAFLSFFLQRAAWAYFGSQNWNALDPVVSPVNNVPAGFPPCFVTDGNTGSFEQQARQLVSALEAKGATCDSFFIPKVTEKTPHEYQFVMNTPSGIECYLRTLAFLANYLPTT